MAIPKNMAIKLESQPTDGAREGSKHDDVSDLDFLEARIKRNDVVGPASPAQVEDVRFSRRDLGKVLAICLAASAIPAAYFGSKSKQFGSGVTKPNLKLAKGSPTDESFPIVQQILEPDAEKQLKELQASGLASTEVNSDTKNYYEPWRKKDLIDGPIIRRTINGHVVKGKKEVVDCFEAAWKLLDEYEYPFRGNESDFRNNQRQFEICREKEKNNDYGACSPLTGGLHSQGQAFDIKGYNTLREPTTEGMIVTEVLRDHFGFTWGDKGAETMGVEERAKSTWSKLKSLIGKAKKDQDLSKTIKDALILAETNDLVHYQMTKSGLETMKKRGGIEAATKSARKYLESIKKKK